MRHHKLNIYSDHRNVDYENRNCSLFHRQYNRIFKNGICSSWFHNGTSLGDGLVLRLRAPLAPVFLLYKSTIRTLFSAASKADFVIRQVNKDTHYKEDIVYECPPLLSPWCSRLADYTRQDFMKNLVNYFRLKRG